MSRGAAPPPPGGRAPRRRLVPRAAGVDTLTALVELVDAFEETRVVLALQRLDAESRTLVRLSLEAGSRGELEHQLGLDTEVLSDRLVRVRRALLTECERLRDEDPA